jgi:hypothetical protein
MGNQWSLIKYGVVLVLGRKENTNLAALFKIVWSFLRYFFGMP